MWRSAKCFGAVPQHPGGSALQTGVIRRPKEADHGNQQTVAQQNKVVVLGFCKLANTGWHVSQKGFVERPGFVMQMFLTFQSASMI